VDLPDDRPATGAARRESEVERSATARPNQLSDSLHTSLVACACSSHKPRVAELFDNQLRALRRDRAARSGPELFLFERAFDDCLERIELLNRRFERALILGCPDASWPARLQRLSEAVDAADQGPLFAAKARGLAIVEDAWEPAAAAYDLVLAIGTLDTVNDLPLAFRLLAYAMRPNGLLIGAIAGGDTLPQLRAAMRAADALGRGASAHAHPRIEPSALAPLLESAGFAKPVVDLDRVQLSYTSLQRLIADLRAMGATNLLRSRSGALTRAQAHAAATAFAQAGDGERTRETIEILNFAAWLPEAMTAR